MKDSADGSVTFTTEEATGRVGFVKAGLNGDLLPTTQAAPAAKADAYLDKFSQAFGASREQLVQDDVLKTSNGSVVTFTQKYKGVPVFGSLLRVHFDDEGALTAVNGELVPTGDLSTSTKISSDEAGRRAVRLVKAQPPGTDGKADTAGVQAASSTLEVYRHGLTQGLTGGKTEMVYQVEVTNKKNVRDMVFVSATTGKIVNRYSVSDDALERELYEADAQRNLTLVWKEGDALPGTLNEDQESMVRSTGDAYWFFKNGFGRDSYDGAGHVMRTINNDPAIACPNANWNGQTTNYCDGVSSDDVVAHEWGHAYTEYTHGLIYQWQSGALNEGYSDIWGETVDLINGRLDEGEGNLTRKRPVGQCSKYTRGGISATINAPSSIAGPCEAAAAASFGPVFDKAGVTSDVVVAQDDAGDGSATNGCSAFTNAADIAGKWAYVDRGVCTFATKVANAENAGATGIVVGDSVAGRPPISIAGVSDIYGLMVTKGDGDKIKSAGSVVNMTVRDSDTDTKADSYRWLMGEKSDAFGGAIRDMWNPTCYGDPGKVSDAEYVCDTEDNGGVHSNSGVVNHGYSLLVDGGTFNGTTVAGIGLDKAAAIYYKAMTEYQTPVSNFVDHANSLEASCADLTGKAINKLSTAEDGASRLYDKITSTDCAQVKNMATAVELRKDPTDQCGWEPQLDQGAPALCGSAFYPETVYTEGFETGLGDWTLSGENPYGGPTYDWVATDEYRGDHTSTVAKGPDPDAGDCSGEATDISSANYMTSGDITIPDGTSAPRMSFQHYIATETGYDGGNVQLSINGGSFAPIEAAAYTFNAPGKLATAAEGSTNPLEGQDGFTGTDPGTPFGSWGTSQVDLAAAGANPGDTVQLRFAMGRDGCGGVDGWYVDNVKIVICKADIASKTVSTGAPNPVKRTRTIVATTKVTATGTTPTGTVQIWTGGKRVGSGTLNSSGAVKIWITKDFPVGTRTFTAKYLGSTMVKPSSDTFRVRIVK
jgi:Zn-dependent metalloprotease